MAAALIPWFRARARDLPWRRTRDPYAIWVSEIMLQQTQVRTVIPYWERWMQALPDVAALARTPEDRVLKLWEGLGYYSRARNLQKAARLLVERGGVFPDSVEGLLELPGIGRYTAGAIASIAFHRPEPILDGNVIRVLTRLFALGGDPKSSRLNARLWGLAEQLVRAAEASAHAPGACSALNQGLMELGALICSPREPHCAECPVASHCRAHALGRAHRYPGGGRVPDTVKVCRVVVVAEQGGRRFVRQRPDGAVNGGFWE
ncbi:MAG: A/G-specific adenine glycosylase, partial [Verrucomicrobiae bacterium]|nr:A/G-specific adenine glycosylase [Verrucomicrobiae bacterium]